MKINSLKLPITVLYLMSIYSVKTFAQTDKLSLTQDQKFELLLNEKRKINNSIANNESYKIQIYNGDSETSRKELNKFKSDFNNLDATLIFSTPYYKVLVGSFKTKIDAQRHLLEIQKKYATAIIIKPNK